MHRLSRSRIDFGRTVAGVLLLGAMLANCSDIYTDRRETILLTAGDTLSANRVTQMIDPWSKASANNNIVYSGEKMQTASERYRMNRVIPPVNATTSSLQAAQAAQQAAQTTQSGQTSPATNINTPIK